MRAPPGALISPALRPARQPLRGKLLMRSLAQIDRGEQLMDYSPWEIKKLLTAGCPEET